jgi:hypothetical protein
MQVVILRGSFKRPLQGNLRMPWCDDVLEVEKSPLQGETGQT